MDFIQGIIDKYGLNSKVYLDDNILDKITGLVEDKYNNLNSVMVLTDKNIDKIYTKKIVSQLRSKYKVNYVILGKNIKANVSNLEQIRSRYKKEKLIIAVGSGTINDLAKYFSYKHNIEYIIIPTAPSMNGYLSVTASIKFGPVKESFKVHLPKMVIVDMELIASAPVRLIQSGIGDIICRTSSQIDWLLSHFIFGSYYNNEVFEWLIPYEDKLFQCGNKILNDKESIKLLFEMLLISGLTMTICGGSYPASQGEHLIAHCYESLFPKKAGKLYHGEQIAVATLAMLEIQEDILNKTYEILPENGNYKKVITRNFGKKNYKLVNEFKKKLINKDIAIKINGILQGNAQKFKDQLINLLINKEKIYKLLAECNCNLLYKNLGLNKKKYFTVIKYSSYLRRRFTFLDLDRNYKNFVKKINLS